MCRDDLLESVGAMTVWVIAVIGISEVNDGNQPRTVTHRAALEYRVLPNSVGHD